MNGWSQIPGIFDTLYFWYPIFLIPNISGAQYFWYLIFLRPDISETRYLWDPILLIPDISKTQYFWDLIFLSPDISETWYFWDPTFLTILLYFSLFKTISEFFATLLMDIWIVCFEHIKFTLGAEVLSTFCSCLDLKHVYF